MSRSKCDVNLYKAFLQSTSIRYSGVALSDVSPLDISHDSVTRWLNSKELRPRDVVASSIKLIDKKAPSLLVADDSVLSKIHSKKIDLVNYQYSGNEHDVIAGIGLLNLIFYNRDTQDYLPVDYRVYDKESDGKSKNDHFRDMLSLAKQRGINPDAVVMDSWYCSLKNLKCIRDHGWEWVTNLKKNRRVNKNQKLEDLCINEEGMKVHLRGYGWIKVFKFVAKNGHIDYVATSNIEISKNQVKEISKSRWSIEVFHRELKQTCGIESCQARTGRAQRNHICLALMSWIEAHKIRTSNKISLYKQKWLFVKKAISENMRNLLLLYQSA